MALKVKQGPMRDPCTSAHGKLVTPLLLLFPFVLPSSSCWSTTTSQTAYSPNILSSTHRLSPRPHSMILHILLQHPLYCIVLYCIVLYLSVSIGTLILFSLFPPRHNATQAQYSNTNQFTIADPPSNIFLSVFANARKIQQANYKGPVYSVTLAYDPQNV